MMRKIPLIALAMVTLTLSCLGLAQQEFPHDMLRSDALAAAEYAWPSSEVPALFSPDSISERFANESEDRVGASIMESRILAEIENAQRNGLIVRRTDVECRTATCALILVHATPQAAVTDLVTSLNETLGLTEFDRHAKIIPLSNELGMAYAYVELLLQNTEEN